MKKYRRLLTAAIIAGLSSSTLATPLRAEETTPAKTDDTAVSAGAAAGTPADTTKETATEKATESGDKASCAGKGGCNAEMMKKSAKKHSKKASKKHAKKKSKKHAKKKNILKGAADSDQT